MSETPRISDEKLSALLDKELDQQEQSQLHALMQSDPSLALRYQQLAQIKESVLAAYASPPLPADVISPYRTRSISRLQMVAASLVFLMFGGLSGWFGGTQLSPQAPEILSLSAFDTNYFETRKKVLIHINSSSPDKVKPALQTAEQLLQAHAADNNHFQLEVVANEDGVRILGRNSRYTDDIKSLSQKYSNVSFKACGIAKKVVALKDQRDMQMLPEAQNIPAALDHILLRIKEGWTYVKS